MKAAGGVTEKRSPANKVLRLKAKESPKEDEDRITETEISGTGEVREY
jgi:hypothetical protein